MPSICFVSTVPATLSAFVLDTARHLHDVGSYEVAFICDRDDAFAAGLPEYVRYIPVPMKRGISVSGLLSTLRLYAVFRRQRFDIVQYSTPNASFYASMAAFAARVPVRLYGQWGVRYVGFAGWRRRVFKAIERVVCALSTWVEPDSPGNLAFGRAEGLYSHAKSSVIWNGSAQGVDLDQFDVRRRAEWRSEIRDAIGLGEDSCVFGFVGRVGREKGINELVASFRTIYSERPDAHLLLVGPADGRDAIDHDVREWSLSCANVHYVGATERVERYLAAMDVLVLASYREGFGSVVVEAEAMGVPVIVTAIPGPTDAMRAGVTGLVVEKADARSLTVAMRTLLNDTAMRLKMGEQGPAYVREHFDRRTLVNHILADRTRLLSVRGAGR